MNTRGLPGFLLLVAGWLPWPGWAGEMLVQGEVVKVVPITEARVAARRAGDCNPAKPGEAAGLVALLAWDLRAHCVSTRARQEGVTGYRVYYRWNGRTYSRVMDRPPGDTVALRVRVN